MRLRIEPLGPEHDRGAFSCGVAAIDDCLIAFDLTLSAPPYRLYVAVDETHRLVGYYALGPTIWEVQEAPKKTPKTNVLRSIELELIMVGVIEDLQGQGIVGVQLMIDAFRKSLEAARIIGGIKRLWVGPLNDRCRKFYRDAGFTQAGNSKRLFMTLNEIADALPALDGDI